MTVALELRALASPLAEGERRKLRRFLSALLAWQGRLDRFPRAIAGVDATPIVSLYADGRLVGCCASTEGSPGERARRAFLMALGDLRFGGVPQTARRNLVAQIAYPVRMRRISLDAAPRMIAPGVHGVALANGPHLISLLVPDVAREHGLDASGLLCALEHKTGLARGQWPPGGLFMFETDVVVARHNAERTPKRSPDPIEAGIRWLSERVHADGSVGFGVDPRAMDDEPRGPMLHGRAAVVVQALATRPSGISAARRARAWLEHQIHESLSGRPVDGWPADLPAVAGTLALAQLAGISVEVPLRELARRSEVAAVPWHAAQVACALGAEAPESLWNACSRSLDRDPRAPWIALAAARRGDFPVFERVCDALAASIREQGPHRGGVGDAIPETALTAITVEALSEARSDPVRRARDLASEFLERNQLLADAVPEARHPARVHGAFPLTPVHGFLRSDVTAHAVLAMGFRDGSK